MIENDSQMTPAINLLTKQKIIFDIHQYQHDSSHSSFGLEAVEKLGLQAEQVFKTLVVENENKQLAVIIIPVNCSLNLKLAAKALGCKKAQMADKNKVERTTGYILGGVSPIAQKKLLKTVIDINAQKLNNMYVSAGKRGLEVSLAPNALASITKATFASLTQ